MQQHWKGTGTYSTIGLEIALSVVVGLFVGRWLDGKFHTHWLTPVGFVYGLVAAGRSLWRVLKRANREADASEQKEREERKKFDDRT